ncbi:hypothetical protein ABLE93_22560, partial [Xanthobacter sp. KR7-65]
ELARAVDHRNRSLTMQINKVHAVRTLALVARDLGEDVDWLADRRYLETASPWSPRSSASVPRQGNDPHQSISLHALFLDLRLVAELRQPARRISMKLAAGDRLAEDEGLVPKISELEFVTTGKGVMEWQHSKNARQP